MLRNGTWHRTSLEKSAAVEAPYPKTPGPEVKLPKKDQGPLKDLTKKVAPPVDNSPTPGPKPDLMAADDSPLPGPVATPPGSVSPLEGLTSEVVPSDSPTPGPLAQLPPGGAPRTEVDPGMLDKLNALVAKLPGGWWTAGTGLGASALGGAGLGAYLTRRNNEPDDEEEERTKEAAEALLRHSYRLTR